MPNKEIYTAESPISVKMLNGFVQDGQIEHQNEGEIWLLSKEKIQNLLTTKTDKTYFTKFIFNESVTTLKDGYTYYGSTIDNATVSSGTYYFYNCTGALTVSGNSAKIYATNSPGMVINGKTSSNWQNIWVDGKRYITFSFYDYVSTFSVPFDSYNYCFVHVMDANREYIGATISFCSNAISQWINVIADDSGTFKYFSGQLEAKWADGYYKFSANVGGANLAFYIIGITLV